MKSMSKYPNKLKTPSGFRDLLPQEASGREYIIESITRVYKRFGFLPLETPVAEFENVLMSESANDFNLFRLEPTTARLSDSEKDEIALRFDLTVPLARVVSQYGNSLPRPFKRYQSGYVFRGERPQKGRYRQFMQFDADIVGTKNIVADTEMIQMITEIMKELKVSDFVVRVNTRTLLNSLPQFISCPENILREILIVLDKSEKISQETFEEELVRLRVSEQGIKLLKEFSNIFGEPFDVVQKLKEFFQDFEGADEGIQELENLAKNLRALGIEHNVWFDMKIIRGFGYYTGIVYETNLLQGREFGSVISGGRYDNLVERFTGQSIASVGVSVGVDRLETALTELGYLEQKKKETKVLVTSFGLDEKNSALYRLVTSNSLRNLNIPVDLYVGKDRGFKEMVEYAKSINATLMCFAGYKEYAELKTIVVNLETEEEEIFTHNELLDYFKNLL